MTESFQYEDTSSNRVQLENGQIEVFFDGEGLEKHTSIILDTAEELTVIEATSHGVFEYEELILPQGNILVPAEMSFEKRVMGFYGLVEPVIRFNASSLLRTTEYRRDMRFLDIISNVSTVTERKTIQRRLLENEEARIPDILTQQRELFDSDESLELWLRLEAVHNPDKELVGKIIMARLAFFMNHHTHIGMTPIIYNAAGTLTRIPPQLEIHENWLYTEAT
ncbi:MAG: hypothetical protein EOT05_00035 [Candidatus Microsaccharimonas sossegonensis]|uniref:Uncharacterized protein n=1 Tax=Candidatus Microsaccharimonas sossegonensis TaxID=2506948 RepID=A0A4Q0AG81_9BACT|nr:MAG: hypothetical protein EOT05_00035 [Candidatus Microsaccharimonas sossegonensis]